MSIFLSRTTVDMRRFVNQQVRRRSSTNAHARGRTCVGWTENRNDQVSCSAGKKSLQPQRATSNRSNKSTCQWLEASHHHAEPQHPFHSPSSRRLLRCSACMNDTVARVKTDTFSHISNEDQTHTIGQKLVGVASSHFQIVPVGLAACRDDAEEDDNNKANIAARVCHTLRII